MPDHRPCKRGGGAQRPIAALACGAALAASLVAGCTVPRPVPTVGTASCALPSTPLVVELPSARVSEAAPTAEPLTELLRRAAEARSSEAGPANAAAESPLASHLVLSGGGQHGAFGTGFLAGLEPLPDYAVVTGVSTGALQAPLALLGNAAPPEDRQMASRDDFPSDANRPGRREIDDLVSGYTITREASLYRSGGPVRLVRRATLGDLEPLRARVRTLITPGTLRRLAALDRRRHGLFILLLNWDTGDAEQVDMLELARRYAGGQAHARDCFIDVMIAASSEPLGTPPVPIDNHLYVDAGLRFGVFAAAAARAGAAAAEQIGRDPAVSARAPRTPLVRTDLIRNGDLDVRRAAPSRYSALDVMKRGRTILVNQVYAFSIREILRSANAQHQVRFAFITTEEMDAAPPASGVDFDPAYMRRMLALGRERGERNQWNLP